MLRDWVLRLRSLFRRTLVDRDLEEELSAHIEHQADRLMRPGVTRPHAIRQARLALGGLDQVREAHRDARGIRVLDDLLRDARHAVRHFRRSPAFAVTGILCLGLGVGANTAIFAVINALLLRPLPVVEPDRLIRISRSDAPALSFPLYRELRPGTQALRGIAATLSMESDVDVDGDSHFVAAEVVTANYANVFGVVPSLGRWFLDDRERVAVISDAVWERQFGRNPRVLGRTIRSGTDTYTIVGVAPREFTGVRAPIRTDLWIPIETRFQPATLFAEREIMGMMTLVGRLHPGTTASQAAAELNALDAHSPTTAEPLTARPHPIVAEAIRTLPTAAQERTARTFATLLAAVVATVLMIACVNVGYLLLARGALRQREFAVRLALGASRARLFRQVFTEALVLAVAGALCGLVLAVWTGGFLERSLPAAAGIFALQFDLSLDWRALVFAAAACTLTTVLCGLVPAWRTAGMAGHARVRGIVGARVRRRPVGLVAQVTMSLVLVFISGSFMSAWLRLLATDPGFEVTGRLYAYTFLPSPPYDADGRRGVYVQALERLRALPGVRTVALTSSLPLIPAGGGCASLVADSPVRVTTSAVDAAYFETMGIAPVAGRTFAASDLVDTASNVIVSESLARRLWPARGAVGQRVMLGCDRPQPADVIGVVRDSTIRAVGEPVQPHVYRAFGSPHAGALTAVLLATATDPATMTETVRRTLHALAPGIRVYAVQPLRVHVERSFGQLRWLTTILTGSGLLALLLAIVGLYGAIAYRVTLRTREIGLRMALGATRRTVLREVVGYGLAIVLAGVVLGELCSAGLTGVVASVQPYVGPTPLSTHVAAGLIWIAVGLGASYVPAARAARLDPLVALRDE